MVMPNLQELFDEKYYRNLTGGILEAFGRLFSRDLILFVYPMLNAHGHTYHAADAEVHPRFKPIFDYLLHNKRIRDIEEFDPSILHIFSREVLQKIRSGEEGWEQCLPLYVDQIIKEKGLFGYKTELRPAL